VSIVLTIVNAWRPVFCPHLQEVEDFGTNPGALQMLTYLPDDLSPRSALVRRSSWLNAVSGQLRTRGGRLVDISRPIWLCPC